MSTGRMGKRQRWAWIAAGLTAAIAAKGCGLGWLWVGAGGLAVILYYMYLDCRLRPAGLAVLLGRTVPGRIFAALTLVWTAFVMGWTAILADTAFPMVDGFPSMGWILLVLAAAGSWKGPGACGRCAGILCLFLAALYGTVTGFSLPDVEVSYLRPTADWQNLLSVLGLFLLPAPAFFLPCRTTQKPPLRTKASPAQGEVARRAGGVALGGLYLLLPLFAALLAAVTAGVLSPELAADLPAPFYTVAQSVSLFGVIERIEPLLSAAMTMGVFCLLSVQACACGALGKTLGLGKWTGPAACVAAALLMYPARSLTLPILTTGSVLLWLLLPLFLTLHVRQNP